MAIVKRIIGSMGGLVPLKVLFKYYWNDFIVLTYHSLSGFDTEPEINRFPYRTKSVFGEDIEFITNNFNVLPLKEFLEITEKGGKFPERSLLITFDDGLAIQYDHMYPVLKSHNIPATFFINNAFIDNRDLHYERKKYLILRKLKELQDISVEREISQAISKVYGELQEFDLQNFIKGIKYKSKHHLDIVAEKLEIPFSDYLHQNRIYMSTQEIYAMLENNMTIGAHSTDHPDFTELSMEDQVEQTLSSMNDLVERFQLDYKVFAFPYNDRALDIDLFNRIGDGIDATFGSSGLLKDEFKMHFQRGSIDNSSQSFRPAMAVLFSKYYGLKLIGNHIIKRY